jgi:hypothetical protein
VFALYILEIGIIKMTEEITFDRACQLQKQYLESLTPQERDKWHRNMYITQCARHLEDRNTVYMNPPGGYDERILFKELQTRWNAVEMILPNGDRTWRLTR